MVSVGSRSEALKCAHEGGHLDMLVTDYHLDGGETGLDVIASVRTALGHELPVVLVTGDTSSAMRKLPRDPRLRLASKPINAEELLTMMKELLAGR